MLSTMVIFPDIMWNSMTFFIKFAKCQNFPDTLQNSLTIPWPWEILFLPDISLTAMNPEVVHPLYAKTSLRVRVLKAASHNSHWKTSQILQQHLWGNARLKSITHHFHVFQTWRVLTWTLWLPPATQGGTPTDASDRWTELAGSYADLWHPVTDHCNIQYLTIRANAFLIQFFN